MLTGERTRPFAFNRRGETMKLNIAGVIKESIVDGRGMRYTVFVQGCPHHCHNCHNPQTWAFEGGTEKTTAEIFEDFKQNQWLRGITFSGGEPFCQPAPLAELARMVHEIGKDVTVYTGYTYEQLLQKNSPDINALLSETDVLIDGPFVDELKNLELHFRGSENQRLIDMKKTAETGKITLLDI